MKQAMIIQWNNPARINELCMHLDTLPCKGSVAEYIHQYQEIESQIPVKDMSLGDHIYKFITHLPLELYMTLIPWTEEENDIMLFYSAAWMWEGFHKIPQKLATSRHWQGPSKYPWKLHHPFPSPYSTTTLPHLSNGTSTSSTSDPMDLDLMNVSWDPRKPPSSV